MIEKIQFYTAGCPRSQISEKNLKKAMSKLGIEFEVESIDDPKIHEADGVPTPASGKRENEMSRALETKVGVKNQRRY